MNSFRLKGSCSWLYIYTYLEKPDATRVPVKFRLGLCGLFTVTSLRVVYSVAYRLIVYQE